MYLRNGRGFVSALYCGECSHSRCIAFFGTHLGENMHNTAVQDLSHANAAGATFITVDPRFSILAGKSKYWLPIKPGTDTALLLAWINVLAGGDTTVLMTQAAVWIGPPVRWIRDVAQR